MTVYECGQNDLGAPPLPLALVDVNGNPVNVSDLVGSAQMLWLRPDGSMATVPLTTVNAIMGAFQRTWATGDTAIPGVHRAQVLVTRAAGQQTFPQGGTYYRWVVHPQLQPELTQLQNAGATTALFGQAVYLILPGEFELAQANSLSTSHVVGVVSQASILASATGSVATVGQFVTGATAQWDAIAGTSDGLVPGTTYYLSPTTAGNLTATKPTTPGQVVQPVLYATTSTQAEILNAPPVQL